MPLQCCRAIDTCEQLASVEKLDPGPLSSDSAEAEGRHAPSKRSIDVGRGSTLGRRNSSDDCSFLTPMTDVPHGTTRGRTGSNPPGTSLVIDTLLHVNWRWQHIAGIPSRKNFELFIRHHCLDIYL